MTTILISINGVKVSVEPNITVASALANSDEMPWRKSVSAQPRAPLCGMGVCFECRVWIDGITQRSCQLFVREGMEIRTHD